MSDNKPFNGTFDGNGYCIIGLNVNSSEYGGLFEIIGENGCVKDLFVFDCDFSSSSRTAGGIAAVNEGTIDHCTSGVNTGKIYGCANNGKVGTSTSSISGGLVGKNGGTI